ncbi:MAG: PP2C family protein-serine/threonine phosphatase [Acidobacteriaceae bacterium]
MASSAHGRNQGNVPGGPPPGMSPGQTFLERITDGLKAEQLWAQFKADATSGYSLYKKELAPVEGGRRHRTWETIKQFFWAVMRKLTPVRRIMLLAGIFFTAFPVLQYESGDQQVSVHLNFLGGVILIALLILEVGDRVTMKRDLEIAREIQMWLVPDAPPNVAGLDIAFVNRPQNTVAGDYYDVLVRNGGERALLVVADVAGKSIPAGLLMATFQASLKTLLNHTSSLAEIVKGVNEYACAHSNGGRRFTTALVAEYEPACRRLSYVNAGHNAPILLRADGRIERLERGGLPFGINSDAPYDQGIIELAPGDLLMIFTDGLVEAVNERGDEYGEPRLLAIAPVLRQYKAKDALAALMGELERFTGMAHQHDDITCMLVKAE